ncbi:MAG: tetratricopeptide repeat protein [Pseudomonadota bacterium]
MPLRDRYDNPLSTASHAARDAYDGALDALLAGAPDMVSRFEAVAAVDPGFALGHADLSRARLVTGDGPGARAALADALQAADSGGADSRERSHINVFDLMLQGRAADALAAVRAHVADHPRDALVVQTSTTVFGLIGFSGMAGREAEQLAFNAGLADAYGDDWWFLSQLAFAACEAGQTDRASALIDRSLALQPRNAHGAHVRSHASYEAGDVEAGRRYLADWLEDYDRSAVLHGHLSWHVALWSLQQGDDTAMWRILDADVAPGAAQGVPLNVLTDTASLLFRAQLAGLAVPQDRWKTVSAYARKVFPKPGLAFADFHAALAHAMAGETEALARLREDAAGPVADLVRSLADAFDAFAAQRWAEAAAGFSHALGDHARLGGSRAQRDLLDFALLAALLKLGRAEEARRLLALRRPAQAAAPLAGLH